MDFTLQTYRALLEALKGGGYTSVTFADYVRGRTAGLSRFVILRHDVDLLPQNSLRTATMEHALGLRGTYYFRAVAESWDEDVIRQLAAMGHEVGYHYETLTTCRGDVGAAYREFCTHLGELRRLVPVSTICMHGSPRSPYDSKDIWKTYSYKELGLAGEPYFDTDYARVFYLTDTGRRWDGYKVSVRDRIEGWQDEWVRQGLTFHATADIISAAGEGRLPQALMMTVHPQRWNDFGPAWLKEYAMQNVKNVVKGLLIALNDKLKPSHAT